LPDEDVRAEEFKIYSNPLFDEDEINSDKLDPHCFNVEYDFVESFLNRDTFIDFSSKFDFSSELAHIKPEIPKSDFDFEEEIRLIENLLLFPVQDGNSQQEEIDIVTETDDVLPPIVENDNDDYDLLLEEVDLFLSDNSIPPGIENVAGDPEGDIQPPDDNFDLEPEVISAVMEDIDEPDEHFNPGGEIFVSTNIEDVDYFPFMFVIRIFLPYLIFPDISPLSLSTESEDTIFDHAQSRFSFPIALPKDELIQGSSRAHDSDYPPKVEAFLCRICVRFPGLLYPLIDFSLGRSISMIYIAYSLIVPPLCSKF
nr:hypothetical protein [Tanacetum cinerariifolium]